MMISGNWTIDEDARGLPIARTLDEANARLIAAAPDLLAALEATAAAFETIDDWYGLDELDPSMVRDAIRKARGEDA